MTTPCAAVSVRVAELVGAVVSGWQALRVIVFEGHADEAGPVFPVSRAGGAGLWVFVLRTHCKALPAPVAVACGALLGASVVAQGAGGIRGWGMRELQAIARALFAAGVAAAEPAAAVARHLDAALADAPGPGGRWQLIALGKAACAMAEAALARLPPGTPALVVTTREAARALPGAKVLAAGHPVPDAAGEAAGRVVEAALAAMRPADRVLALISGGGSALLPTPAPGLSLADKAVVNRLLLGSGADIGQMNLVRQALSRLKGGGWLRACKAPITALILSDVPGDDLRLVASGPTVAPLGSRAEAVAALHALGLWAAMPPAVRAHLAAPAQQLPPPPPARNLLIGANALSLAAMVSAGAALAPFSLRGDVGDMATEIVATLAAMAPGQVLVAGGETTVRLRGQGLGGRNQELALRVALGAEAAGLSGDWAFLAAGSDGRDGPTEAAGAVVGPATLAAMRRAGHDPAAHLAENDSLPALAAAGALIVTGATGTNVADLAVLLRG